MASNSDSFHLPKHEVFLSFRGEDTRYNFTSYLLKALKDKGIGVFFDDEKLETGEELSPALLGAIAASKISIIILSKGYASSSWCLIELSEIMERYTKGSQLVVPIFYHVTPSDVRKHAGSFEQPFALHQINKPNELVEKWKAVFTQVADLKGSHIIGNRSEPEEIKEIVEKVIKKLNRMSPRYSKGLVGIDDQTEQIKSLLHIGEEGICVIGIWGMGGIGKTTLAEVVYNEVSAQFDSYCFLEHVREDSQKGGGIISLRDKLLSKIFKKENFHIDSTPRIGSKFTLDRLGRKRVLVVLDDVSDFDQFETLLCSHDHLGSGSRIIITSRDKQVLKNCGVDDINIYKVEELSDDNSLQLFSPYAFKRNHPVVGFRDLSKRVLQYAKGVPIALKVLGSTLYQRRIDYWESMLNKLKEDPNPKILSLLKISFDGLDDTGMNIFLDIACFFKGHNTDSVKEILDSCYYVGAARCGIDDLVDKCLVTITNDCNLIWMHDLLQEMGRDVVCKESEDPGKRSRLWNPKDVCAVFKNNKGSESIKGIILDMSQIDSDLQLYPTSFEKMIHLRILKIYSSWHDKKHCNKFLLANHDPQSLPLPDALGFLRWDYYMWKFLLSKFKLKKRVLESLPDELRYLWWENYPSKSLPLKFNPKNLVELSLQHGQMEQLWNGDHQDLVCLREIDLSGCKKLRKIPNLLGAIKLEVLTCYGCESLDELPSLKHLTSLTMLLLSGCYKLKKFPEIPHDLSTLELQETKIEEVPDSIEHATQLHSLEMRYSRVKKVSSNISKLESLWHLDFSHCPIEELPSSIGCLNKLECLLLGGTRIQNLPSYISKLDALAFIDLSDCPNITELNFGHSSMSSFKSLKSMSMDHCKSLKLLSELPPSLHYFSANGCTSLENVSFTCQCVSEFNTSGVNDLLKFSNCFKLNQDSIDNIVANAMLRIGSIAKQIADEYLRGKIHVRGDSRGVFCRLTGNEILEKFEHQSLNSSIILKIGPNRCSGIRFLVFTLCFVFDLKHRHNYKSPTKFICEGRLKAKVPEIYKNFEQNFYFQEPAHGEHMFVLFNADLVHYDMDYEEASFEFYAERPFNNFVVVDDIKVEKFGVNISYVEYNDVEKVHNDYTTKMRPGHKRSLAMMVKGKEGLKD